jgi:hypothetical protein
VRQPTYRLGHVVGKVVPPTMRKSIMIFGMMFDVVQGKSLKGVGEVDGCLL